MEKQTNDAFTRKTLLKEIDQSCDAFIDRTQALLRSARVSRDDDSLDGAENWERQRIDGAQQHLSGLVAAEGLGEAAEKLLDSLGLFRKTSLVSDNIEYVKTVKRRQHNLHEAEIACYEKIEKISDEMGNLLNRMETCYWESGEILRRNKKATNG